MPENRSAIIDWHRPRSKGKPSKISMVIHCENASFDDSWRFELGRILRDIGIHLQSHDIIPDRIRDENGNTIGSLKLR